MKKQKCNADGDPTIITIDGIVYWTSERAAEYLKISKMTLYNYTRQKRIFKLELGGRYLYQKKCLDDFIAESTTS